MSGALPRGGGHRGIARAESERPGEGKLGGDSELSRERRGGRCSHMEMEVTELSAVGGDGEEGRAESVFRERSWEFRGSRGERVTARKEPVPSVGAERRGKDTWGIWCRAVSCVLAGEDFKAVRFSGGNG